MKTCPDEWRFLPPEMVSFVLQCELTQYALEEELNEQTAAAFVRKLNLPPTVDQHDAARRALIDARKIRAETPDGLTPLELIERMSGLTTG